MKLSVDQIVDYQYCPRFFKLCHIDKLKQSKQLNIEKHFEYCMKKTILHFFFNIQEGNIISLKELKRYFGSIYIGDRSVAETIMLDRSHRNTARVLEKKSIKMLKNFHDRYSIDHGLPIFIDKEYTLSINGIELNGTIPMIREFNRELEINHFYVDTSSHVKYSLPTSVNYDIRITAASLAFEKAYNRIQKHSVYGVYSGKEIITNKKEEQYEQLKNTVRTIGTAIQNGIFFPVLNNQCISCTYNKECKKVR